MKHIETKVTQIKDIAYFHIDEYTIRQAQIIEPAQVVNEIYHGTYRNPKYRIYDPDNDNLYVVFVHAQIYHYIVKVR